MYCKRNILSYLLNNHKNIALDDHIHCVHKADYNETQYIRNSVNTIHFKMTFSLVTEVQQFMQT
jgi:hypothetical protein